MILRLNFLHQCSILEMKIKFEFKSKFERYYHIGCYRTYLRKTIKGYWNFSDYITFQKIFFDRKSSMYIQLKRMRLEIYDTVQGQM